MRKVIIILLLFLSCNNKAEDDFDNCLSIVKELDAYADNKAWNGIWNDTMLGQFHIAVHYLEHLTGIKGSYSIYEVIPSYETRKKCLYDIKKWNNWYKANEKYIVKHVSDSIKLEAIEIQSWLDKETALKLVFNIDGISN